MRFRNISLIAFLIIIIALGIVGTSFADEETPPVSEPGVSRSKENPTPLTFPLSVAGDLTVAPSDEFGPALITPLIVGGTEVSPQNAYPWVASLQYFGHHYCGGTLIDPQWVLTAAHCWVDPGGIVYPIKPQDKVILGEHHLNVWDEVNQQWIYYISGREQEIGIAEVHLHPNFNYNTFEYDVALLKLTSPATINSYVQTINLVSVDLSDLIGQPSLIVGWGTTVYNGDISDVARYANISILADSACSNYGTSYSSTSMLCGGLVDGSRDSCQGDSGGPLAYQSGGVWKQAGIVSWGYECGVAGYPGVYARISSSLGWIRMITRGTAGDFDGNRTADIGIYRPSNGRWYLYGLQYWAYGIPGDIPVPGDYNGDGSYDVAIYRPSTGRWYIKDQMTIGYGIPGDKPVHCDFDGDGDTDIAVYRPSNGRWYFQERGTYTAYGILGDLPVPADYDGDGICEIAIYRPSNGRWYFQEKGTYTAYGIPGDLPVPADYDGDGDSDVAIYRPSNGRWYFQEKGTYTAYGIPGDLPVPADYDGDGDSDVAIYRPSNGRWYIKDFQTVTIGIPGDIPIIRRFYIE